jgi:ABC-type oligopeptide transport system substrate-binding subunit
MASTASTRFLDSLLYSGLVKFSPDLHVIPELAVSLPTISSDGRIYTFTVRQDARFADRRPCTAADVAYSLTRALSPSVDSQAARAYLGNIQGARALERGDSSSLSGVRVTHRLTLRIRLVHPDADFLAKLATPVADVVDRSALEPSWATNWMSRPAGTGPWVVEGRDRRGVLTLVPRHHFYGGAMDLKTLVLVPVRSEAEALDLYRRGSIDVAQVPATRVPSLSVQADFHQSDSLDAYFAFDDSGSAAGLAAALDRNTLLHDSSPSVRALSTIVPPAVPDYVSSDPTIQPLGSDRLPAVDIQLQSTRDPIAVSLRLALYKQWRHATTGGTRVEIVHARYMLPDPGLWLRLVLPHTNSRWFRSSLLQAGQLTNDPVSRMSLYSQCEAWAIRKGLIIPLASGTQAYLIKPAAQSIQMTPMGIMPANNSWPSVSMS